MAGTCKVVTLSKAFNIFVVNPYSEFYEYYWLLNDNHMERRLKRGSRQFCSHSQWELWIPIVTANGSCLMFIPMGYSQWELWIPMGTANSNCEFQWLHPMGDVDNNGYSQWDLWIPIVTSNGSCGYQWEQPIGTVDINGYSQ